MKAERLAAIWSHLVRVWVRVRVRVRVNPNPNPNQVHGGAALHGRLRFRAPPGATLVVRGPLVLRGPLRARLAPPSGAAVALGDCWLAEGVLRCGLLPLAPLPPSSQPMEAEGAAGSGGEAGALEAAEAVAGAFCELHGASAADEVRP